MRGDSSESRGGGEHRLGAHTDRQRLINAIKNSGGGQNALNEADDLLAWIDFLERTERYRPLVLQLARANDKSNFLALVLEVNFAHQFESSGRELVYEVKQDTEQNSSIDFLRTLPSGHKVFFELRLLQRPQLVTASMNAQLQKDGMNSLAMDGEDE